MKKALLLSALALAAFAPAQAQDEAKTYPVPIERRVPWTIIAGTEAVDDSGNGLYNNPLFGSSVKTGYIADLIDGNPLTFWRTHPDKCDASTPEHTHWFMIDRGFTSSTVPFDYVSIQQRVIQLTDDQDETDAKWKGAVNKVEIYVTNQHPGVQGGVEHLYADNVAVEEFTDGRDATLTLDDELDIFTQEAQIFKFDQQQTGRYILVVITETVNTDTEGDDDNNSDACLSEFDLYGSKTVTESHFPDQYHFDYTKNQLINRGSDDRRTHSLSFSADGSDVVQTTPLLQTGKRYEPYTSNLNWLHPDEIFFDITPLFTLHTTPGQTIVLTPNAIGHAMQNLLYIDWDGDGFQDLGQANQANYLEEVDGKKVLKSGGDLVTFLTSNASGSWLDPNGNALAGDQPLTSPLTFTIPEDAAEKTYRARYKVDWNGLTPTPNPNQDMANNGGIVVDFLIKVERTVNFTVNVKCGDKVVKQENVSGAHNVDCTIEVPPFYNPDILTFAVPSDMQNNGEIDFQVTETLPFAVSENTDNMKWQAIRQHYAFKNKYTTVQPSNTNKTNLTWTYNENTSIVTAESEAPLLEANGFDDNQLWAFVGNLEDGFTIYNKAAYDANPQSSLYKDGSTVKVGESTTNNVWKIGGTDNRSERPSNEYCTLSTDGTNFININIQQENGTVLGSYSAADGGSSCWFIPVGQPLLNFFKNTVPFNDKVVGAPVMGEYYISDEFQEALKNCAIDQYDYTAASALADKTQIYQIEPGKFYHFKNWRWADNYMFTGADDDTQIYGAPFDNHKLNYHTLFTFEPVEGIGEDEGPQYYIKSQDMYIGKAQRTGSATVLISQVASTEDAGKYSVVETMNETKQMPVGTGLMSMRDNTSTATYRTIHQGNAGNAANPQAIKIQVWKSVEGGSAYYITLAEEVDVTLNNTINGVGKVDFVHFPFPVTAGSDGSELYTIYAGYDNTGTESVPVVSYEKVTEVPANTPFMVLHQDADIATLKINYDGIATLAADDAAAKPNVLGGTIRSKVVEAGDYIVGTNDETGAIEFKKQTEAPTIKSNYVYIPSVNLGDAHKAVDALPLNDPTKTETTGIVELNSGNGVKAVYDLQGRKLAAPAKGINIVNGKKVLVK